MDWGVKLLRRLQVISVAAILFRGEGASTSWDFVFLEVMDLSSWDLRVLFYTPSTCPWPCLHDGVSQLCVRFLIFL